MSFSTRSLRLVTLAYLGLPMVLFAIGWTHWPIAVCVIAAIAWFFVVLIRGESAADRRIEVTRGQVIGLVVVCLLWISLSGVGGFGLQNYDYQKHNAVLRVLIDSSWPVRLEGGSEPAMLVYYIGYYLVPAALGKLVGWHGSAFVMMGWTALGLAIALGWVGVVARSMRVRTLVVFALFGGLDIIGQLIFKRVDTPLESWMIEDWSHPLSYQSNTFLLYWVPQHALAAWLATALVLDENGTEGALRTGPWLLAFTVLWSPFVALGLVPLFGASALRCVRERGLSVIPWRLWIPPVVIGLLLTTFFLSIREPMPNGFTPSLVGWERFVTRYLPFCVLEFGIFAIALGSERPPLFRVAIVCLAVIPFYKFGYYNDFLSRASLPSLFVLAIGVASGLSRGFRVRLFAPWLVGTVSALLAIGLSFKWGPRWFSLRIPEYPMAIRNLTPREVAVQYLGRPDSLFFRTLAPNTEDSR